MPSSACKKKAIIDVPSTGNAQLSQRSFLKYRQLPLVLAALTLAEWWALFRKVYGNELFQPADWLFKIVGFTVASYLTAGLLGIAILAFRKQKAGPTHF